MLAHLMPPANTSRVLPSVHFVTVRTPMRLGVLGVRHGIPGPQIRSPSGRHRRPPVRLLVLVVFPSRRRVCRGGFLSFPRGNPRFSHLLLLVLPFLPVGSSGDLQRIPYVPSPAPASTSTAAPSCGSHPRQDPGCERSAVARIGMHARGIIFPSFTTFTSFGPPIPPRSRPGASRARP